MSLGQQQRMYAFQAEVMCTEPQDHCALAGEPTRSKHVLDVRLSELMKECCAPSDKLCETLFVTHSCACVVIQPGRDVHMR